MRRTRLCICLGLTAAACAADDPPSVASATACGGAALGIAQVQGPGPVSPELDRLVTVEGAVTWVGAEADGQTDVFLQALTPDADPRTSEGLLVTLPADADAPVQGERVRVRGWVEEMAGVTAVSRVEVLEHCGSASLRPQQLELSSLPPGERWE